MSSSFLASALTASFDQNIAAAVSQTEEQKQDVRSRQGSALQSPWERAVQIFNNSLTKDETKKLSLSSCPKASLESFIQQVSTAKETATKKRSKVLDRVNDIVSRINLFSKPMDTFSQANQELMFAWGTMKFLMQVVMSEKEISDKLAEAIADIVQIFGRCEQYSQLFSSHDRLLESIGVLYADVLNLLVRATRFYDKGGIKRFVSSTMTPFEIKFAPIVTDIQKHGVVVENEASMAHAKEQKAENDLQRSFRRNIEAQQSDQMSREVRLWLQASNSANDLRKLCETRTADTCAWLLEKERYKSWRTSTESSILWIYGIPGSGKSVLASYIIDNLLLNKRESEAKTPVVYFFCSGRNETQRTSVHILRSLVAQLQAQHPNLGDFVAEAYKSSASRIANSFEELWTLFKEMSEKISVVCVIDGLDECQERDEDGTLDRSTFAHNLVELAKGGRSKESYFKVILTSRNEPDLRTAFQSASDIVRALGISPKDISNDIHTFITNRINTSDALQDLPDDKKVNIITRLDGNASAMFIWARLMIEQLEATESDEALEEALRTLPTGLSALYNRILMSIAHNFERNDSVRDLGCFIICWVVHGARPLTLTELSEARCIKLGETSLSTKKKPRSLATFRRLIEAACAPLVEVQDDGLVQLAHHTTKEYLLTNSERLFNICNPIKTFGIVPCTGINIDYILSVICLSYLDLEQFELPLLGTRKRFALKSALDVRKSHPFLEYATSSLLLHISRSQNSPYELLHGFVQKPQARTWIEAAITLQGGVEKLATTIEYLPTFSRKVCKPISDKSAAGFDVVSTAVIEWFESLQRVIFDLGGTLNQTPSEIHFLDLLGSTGKLSASKQMCLEKYTLLEDPTMAQTKVRPLEQGKTFVLRRPYVYVGIAGFSSFDPFLKRYHWLSMQKMGGLMSPRTDGFMGRVVDIQVCPNQRFLSAVVVGAPKIMVALWSLSDEGFDPVPWATGNAVIGSISTDRIAYGFSHLATFEGPGWRRSARHTAFSEDGKIIWTPAGAFELLAGKKSDIPKCCEDPEVTYATWSFHGQRIACIRGKKTLEIYQNDGKLVATLNDIQIENSMITGFSKSGRYVLLLQTQGWRHYIYDIHLSSLSAIPTLTFPSNPLELEIPTYYENGSILSHSFSPCERYISFLVDDISQAQPGVVGIWDRQTESWRCSQIWSSRGGLRASDVQFDGIRSETLHLLIHSGNHPTMGGVRGFIQVDLDDPRSFEPLRQSPKLETLSRSDVCLSATGGRVFQRMMYSLRVADGYERKVDMIVWDLSKAPPEVQCRFTVPRDERESKGWRDGYSQSNGAYSDWYVLSDESSMFMVGGRLYSFLDKSKSATPVRTFDPTAAWKQLGEESGLSEEDIDRSELEDECFWSYFNPNASLICFYAPKEYIIVYDVDTGNLRWCHKLKGRNTSDYWDSKPVFHPKLPMMAWVEQFGKDGRGDFDSLKHCGVYLIDLSTPDATPKRVTGLEVDWRSDLIFSPCGSFLYGGIIGRDDHNFDERKLKFFKIDLTTNPTQSLSCIKARSPIKGPSYCGSPNPAFCTLILKNDEPHFLVTVEYKVMLAKIEFDGTVKWKVIASLPGPPASPDAIALSGWNGVGKEGRLNIVLAAQNFAYVSVVNTWDGSPGDWDEICKAVHDPSL